MRRSSVRKTWLGSGAVVLAGAAMMAAAPGSENAPAAAAFETETTAMDPTVAVLDPVVASAPAPEVHELAAAAAPGEAVLETQVGSASYYANMLAGRRTASGVRYDPSAAVAAHRSLPFGTRLRVHNLANDRVVEVEVVDRGPFAKGRILDLSRSAAADLGFIRQGHTRVRIEVLEYGS